jgi:hypothetical protein
MPGWDSKIYAWRPDGSLVPGWPVDAADIPTSAIPSFGTPTHDPKIVTTPTLVDIDGDGHPDVFIGLQDTVQGSTVVNYVTAFSSAGNLIANFPLQIDAIAQGYGTATDFVSIGVQTPAALTIPSGPMAIASPELFLNYIIPFSNPNAAFPESPGIFGGSPLIRFTGSPSIGNLLGTTTPQVVEAGVSAFDILAGIQSTPGMGTRLRSALSVTDPVTGANLPQYTQEIQGLAFFTAPAIADITGDGNPDILLSTDSSVLHGFDGVTGAIAAGWPQWTGGWSLATPAVGDLTGDGTVDVAVTTREGYLHIYSTPGLASANHEAWHWHQNDRNTGHYGDDTRPPSGIADLQVSFNGAMDTLSFTAVGDDWKSGTAASYQVFASSKPITQSNSNSAKVIVVSATPQPSGSHEMISVPHMKGVKHYAVRAIDHAGNIGPLPL